MPLRVLIACECSGTVRDAFRRLGHEAWSCDLEGVQPGGEWPNYHLEGDARWFLDSTWDLLIAHPPCRFLSVSGMHWTTRGLRDPAETDRAIAFAEALWSAPIQRICIENPRSVLSTRSTLGKRTQEVQPYQFGEDASKATCLWLKNLPPLQLGSRVVGRLVEWNGKTVERWSNQTDSGQNRLGPSATRAADRAVTYPGIARAMAEQWGSL